MADSNVIDIVIRARDESAAALRATQAAIDEVARAQAALAAAERAKADADRAAAAGSDDQAEALRRQAAAAEAAAAAERRLAEAERAAAAAAARIRGAGGGGGAPPPGGGAGGGGGPGPDDDRLSRVLDSISRDLGGFGEQIKALIPVLNNLKTTTTATATAIAAAGDRLRRGAPPPGPNPPPPPPGPNPPPGPGPNPPPPPPPPGGGRDAAARSALIANLMDVTTQLAGGANPMLILIQQGPALAAAVASASSATALFTGLLSKMGVALLAATPFLAALAVGLAAAAAAWSYSANETQIANEALGIYSVNVEAAEAKVAALSSRLDEIAGMHGKVSDRLKDNARELAVLTGAITKEEATRQRSIETIEEQAKTETEAARLRLAAQGDLLRNMEQELILEKQRGDTIGKGLRNDLQAIGVLGEKRSEQLEASIDATKREIASIEQGLQARQSLMRVETDQVNLIARLSEAKRKDAEADRAREKAMRAAAKAQSEVQAAIKASLPVLKEALAEAKMLDDFRALGIADIVPANFVSEQTIGRARELGDALQALAPSKSVLTDLERLQMLLMDIQRANIDSGGRLGGLEADAEAAVSAAQDEAAAQAGADIDAVLRDFGSTMTAMSDAATQRAAGVGSMIGDIIGGDISGALASLLSATGPVGAAIGGMLGGLAALGEQGAGETAKMITGYLDSLIKGLSSLPALIVKLVPSLIVDVLPNLVVALVGAIPRLVVAILIELPVAIVRGIVGWWRDIGGFKGMARSIADGVRDWWTSTWDRIKSWVRDIFAPGRERREQRREEREARGPSVLETGLNVLAAGEAIFSGRSRTGSPGTPGRPDAARGAGPTIVLQGDLTPDFVPALGRRLDRYNGPGGLRSGTTILGST